MRHQRIFYGKDNFHVDFQSHLMGIKRQWKRSEPIAWLVSLCASRFGTGQWSFLGPGSEKKWSSISEDSPQGEWDNVGEDDVDIRRKRTYRLPCHESIVHRSAQKQRRCKIVDTLFADLGTVKTVLSQIISVKQLCFDGAVVAMCE